LRAPAPLAAARTRRAERPYAVDGFRLPSGRLQTICARGDCRTHLLASPRVRRFAHAKHLLIVALAPQSSGSRFLLLVFLPAIESQSTRATATFETQRLDSWRETMRIGHVSGRTEIPFPSSPSEIARLQIDSQTRLLSDVGDGNDSNSSGR
jgi:hypothetical protein